MSRDLVLETLQKADQLLYDTETNLFVAVSESQDIVVVYEEKENK